MDELLTKEDWKLNLLVFYVPRWEELPEIEIYMDQLIKFVNKHTQPILLNHTKSLTPSMINNYVKLKIIPKPLKRKYSRDHVARIIIITILKQSFEIPDIRKAINLEIYSIDSKHAYDYFCDRLEMTIKKFIDENSEEIDIKQIKSGCIPVQMACTTLVAKLITENNLRELLYQQKMEDKIID